MKKLLIGLAIALVAGLSGVITYFAIPKGEPFDLKVSVSDIVVEVEESKEIDWACNSEDAFVGFEIVNNKIAKIVQISGKNYVTGLKVGETLLNLVCKLDGIKKTATAKLTVLEKSQDSTPQQPNIPEDNGDSGNGDDNNGTDDPNTGETPKDDNSENPPNESGDNSGDDSGDDSTGDDKDSSETPDNGEDNTPQETPGTNEGGSDDGAQDPPSDDGNSETENPPDGGDNSNDGEGSNPENNPAEDDENSDDPNGIILENLTFCKFEENKLILDSGMTFAMFSVVGEIEELEFVYDSTVMTITLDPYVGNNTYKVKVLSVGEFELSIFINSVEHKIIVVRN